MPAKRRGKGIDVEPDAIRLARLEAGLSLAAAAAGIVSRQALQQFETGRARPSLDVLERIAQRLGRSTDEFLARRAAATHRDSAVRMAELELLFETRDFAAAAELATALGGVLRAGSVDSSRAHLYLGASLVGLARAREAVEPLRLAASTARRAGDPLTEVNAMDWEACALHLMDSPGAIALAEQALVRCRTLTPAARTVEARILGHLGSFLVRRREWRRALAAYDAALEAADNVSNLRQLALMHHNLSITYQRLGNEAAAARETQRALALYQAETNKADLARMRSDFGDLLRRQGDLGTARKQLEAALDGFRSAPEDRGRGYTLLTLAEVSIAEKDYAEADRRLAEVERLLAARPEPLLTAYAAQIKAELAAARGSLGRATALYEEAIARYGQIDQPGREAEARIDLTILLEANGDLQGALAQLRAALKERAPGRAAEAPSSAVMPG